MAQRNEKPITTEYIDQLLSASAPKVAPPQKQEVAETAVKPPKTRLLVFAAIALFILGFLAGSLLNRDGAASSSTIPPTTTLPPQFGYIPDYQVWETDSLAWAAAYIPSLGDHALTPERFEALALQYPVLPVLVSREDAPEALQAIIDASQPQDSPAIATQALLYYIKSYTSQLPPYQWLYEACDGFNIYEFTIEPQITEIQGNPVRTVLRFGHLSLSLDSAPSILKQKCNFWFYVPQSMVFWDAITVNGEPAASNTLGVRVDAITYSTNAGFLICGYTPVNAKITLHATQGQSVTVYAYPRDSEGLFTEALLMRTVNLTAFRQYLLNKDTPNFQNHPLMADLLAREDLIPVALQAAQITKFADPSLNHTLMALLSHESVQEKMSSAQKEAFALLKAGRYLEDCLVYSRRPTLDLNGDFPSCGVFYLTSGDAQSVSATDAVRWLTISLSPAAMELNDGSWHPELERGDGTSVGAKLWPTYYNDTGTTQSGWLVAITDGLDPILRLTLRGSDGTIIETQEITLIPPPGS